MPNSGFGSISDYEEYLQKPPPSDQHELEAEIDSAFSVQGSDRSKLIDIAQWLQLRILRRYRGPRGVPGNASELHHYQPGVNGNSQLFNSDEAIFRQFVDECFLSLDSEQFPPNQDGNLLQFRQ